MGYDRYGNRYGRGEGVRGGGMQGGRDGYGDDIARAGRGARNMAERAVDEVGSWFGGDDDDDRHDGGRQQGGMGGQDYGRGHYEGGRGGSQQYGRDFARDDYGARGGRDNSGAQPMGQANFSEPGAGGGFDPGGGYGRGGGGMGASGGEHRMRGQGYSGGGAGAGAGRMAQGGGHPHDPHYHEWRERQISALDRDYDEYRREHQQKFESDFHGWRTTRQSQREAVRTTKPGMEVVGDDGAHVGSVDKVMGDKLILAKNDEAAGGHHHSVPCSWIQGVGEKVMLNKSGEAARKAWQDEENNRAMLGGADDGGRHDGSNGPHILERSFSGTYNR